mmetsp:Transcript_15540/g.29321  ORF Transcript_15540/g.29321 Transcript_15540/m.29321 type:complete len:331 (-) Transcript_15540:1042-2034(-)
MPVTCIQVANGIGCVRDVLLHTLGALHWCKPRSCRPRNGGARAKGPAIVFALLLQVGSQSSGAAGSCSPVADLNELSCRHTESRIYCQDVWVVPGGNVPSEDTSKQAVWELQRGGTRHAMEDADGTQGEGQVQHGDSLSGHGVEAFCGHGNVPGPEMVVGRPARARLARELLLTRTTSHGTVGQEKGSAGTVLHLLHHLSKPVPGVGGATAMQRDHAEVIQVLFESLDACLESLVRQLQLVGPPQGVGVPLHADHIQSLPRPGTRRVLEGEHVRVGCRLGDLRGPYRGPGVHLRRHRIEGVLRQQGLALGAFRDVVDEGLQQGGFVHGPA